MKILVIDDEKPALNLLVDTINHVRGGYDEIVSFTHPEEFDNYVNNNSFDVAFVDIELGRISGIQLAFKIKKHSPTCNIIFVTSYSQYGVDAFKVRPSGYVLKPYTEEEIKTELENLRNPVEVKAEKKLRVITFGNFVVYKDKDELLHFTRTASKEIFAYLIDCCGYPVTTSEIAEDVLEKDLDKQISKNLSKIIKSMMDDLEKAGYPDVIIKQNRQIQINKNRVSCDFYDALNGDVSALNSYHGEYLIDYSWAELSESAARIRSMINM
jgi:two-component SAPR family response regulator